MPLASVSDRESVQQISANNPPTVTVARWWCQVKAGQHFGNKHAARSRPCRNIVAVHPDIDHVFLPFPVRSNRFSFWLLFSSSSSCAASFLFQSSNVLFTFRSLDFLITISYFRHCLLSFRTLCRRDFPVAELFSSQFLIFSSPFNSNFSANRTRIRLALRDLHNS